MGMGTQTKNFKKTKKKKNAWKTVHQARFYTIIKFKHV